MNFQQNFFSRQLYFKSMLDTKNRVYQSLMRSSNGGENLDVKALQATVQELNEKYVHSIYKLLILSCRTQFEGCGNY